MQGIQKIHFLALALSLAFSTFFAIAFTICVKFAFALNLVWHLPLHLRLCYSCEPSVVIKERDG